MNDIDAIRARLTANPRAVRPEDAPLLLAEVERLRAKNTELNRRATKAEAFVGKSVDELIAKGHITFGRALANQAAADARRRVEELEEFQNSIADRMPEHYDGDEAQEALITRWLDEITTAQMVTMKEALDGLPVGSVVLDAHDNPAQKFTRGWLAIVAEPDGSAWLSDYMESIALPAEILKRENDA